MSDPAETFDATEKARIRIPTMAKIIDDFAFDQAGEFIAAGQSTREATSIVANMLIRSAWTIASIAVLDAGGVPDKDKFRAAVESQLESITFKTIKKEGGAA